MPRGPLVVQLKVTPGGVREDVNQSGLPEGTFMSSVNFLTRQGQGRPRPGTATLFVGGTSDRVLGFGVRGEPGTTQDLVVQSVSQAVSWSGGAVTDITGTWNAAASLGNLARMVSFNSGGTLWLARTNLENPISKWSGTGDFQDITGAPLCRDIMVLGRRLVGVNIINSSGTFIDGVQWSGFNDIDTWNTLDFTILNETPGACVACAPFGPLSGAIYKSSSVYLASQQAAKDPFQFQLVRRVPGPIGTAALVPYLGNHYWLAEDGAIYVFDGASVEVVSRGMIVTFPGSIDWPNRARAFGFVLANPEPELWWVYPNFIEG